jgi:D-alanyl-D-alanine carboxypeptidase
MPDVGFAPVANGAASRFVDRRTLLVGAAGVLAGAGLSGPARAAASATSLAARGGPRFDPQLARQLRKALHASLRDPSTLAPGAILQVQSPKLGRWSGAAGLGRVTPAEPMRPGDRFRAGSNAADITVRMLLGHRAGIPDWDDPALDEQVAREPAKVWNVSELLDLAAAKAPLFAPGTSFSYSNTDYTLLGLIVERITGRSWRHEVTRQVIRPLRLTRTALPAAGQRSIKGPLAHGYGAIDGKLVDLNIDPSFAGAAGGYALATTVGDLARFLDTLLAGRLFRHRATLKEMLTIGPAQGEGGLVGYGLGIEQRALPGGPTLIGHLGGAVYRSYVGRLHPTGATIALAMNAEDDPTPLLLPAVKALLATHR